MKIRSGELMQRIGGHWRLQWSLMHRLLRGEVAPFLPEEVGRGAEVDAGPPRR